MIPAPAETAYACLRQFAEKHRLRIRRPTKNHDPRVSGGPKPDTPYIPGKHGWIRQLDSGGMKLVFMGVKQGRYRLNRLLREAKETGMRLQGRGDYEVLAMFHGDDEAQVKVALWAIQARRRGISSCPPSLAQIEARRRFGEANRMPVPASAPEEKGHPVEVRA